MTKNPPISFLFIALLALGAFVGTLVAALLLPTLFGYAIHFPSAVSSAFANSIVVVPLTTVCLVLTWNLQLNIVVKALIVGTILSALAFFLFRESDLNSLASSKALAVKLRAPSLDRSGQVDYLWLVLARTLSVYLATVGAAGAVLLRTTYQSKVQ